MYGATELFVPYERVVELTTPSKTYKQGTVESTTPSKTYKRGTLESTTPSKTYK